MNVETRIGDFLIQCELCKKELQLKDIAVSININGEVIKICKFCGNEVIIK